MSSQSTKACCKKGAVRIANVLYCSTCGTAQQVGVVMPPEDPLLQEREKYDGMLNVTPARLAQTTPAA
jgi:hypothetical protein